jgi:hypothetical protein
MITRSAFDLDCTPMIPGCGFKCPKCIQEIESTLTSMQGVSRCYLEGEAAEAKIVVEHDPTAVTVEQLIDVFRSLPSFYEGCFIPTMITS